MSHCPSAKSIYLDGIAYFPEMLKEATDLMAEKQLYTRMPLEELDALIELQNEADDAKDTKDVVTILSSDDE